MDRPVERWLAQAVPALRRAWRRDMTLADELVVVVAGYVSAAAFVAMLVVLALASHYDRQQVQVEVQSRARALAEQVASGLGDVISGARALGASSITANALFDSGEFIDLYLRPYFGEHEIAREYGGRLTLHDYRGRIVWSPVAPEPDDGLAQALAIEAVARSAPVGRIVDGVYWVAVPVTVRQRSTAPGSVVARVPLQGVVDGRRDRSATPDASLVEGVLPADPAATGEVARLGRGGLVDALQDSVRSAAPVELADRQVAASGLQVVLQAERAALRDDAASVIWTALATGLGLVAVMWFLAKAGARRVTLHLQRFTRAVETIREGDREVPAEATGQRRDLVVLADAFNGVLRQRDEAHRALEAVLSERTAQLAETESRLGFILGSMRDLSLWSGPPDASRLEFLSRSPLPGWEAEQIVADSTILLRAVHPDDLAEVRELHAQALSTGRCEGAFRVRLEDGGVRWLYVLARCLVGNDCRPVRVVGLLQDITQAKTMEARLDDRTRHLNSIASLSRDGFAMVDAQGAVVYANRAFHEVLDLRGEERHALTLESLNSRFCEVCIESAHSGGECAMPGVGCVRDTGDYGRRVRVAQSCGERSLLVSVRPTGSASGERVIFVRDVTLEEEVDRMKSDFVSTAAHELRTPMANVLGYSELLITKNLTEEKRRRFLGTINAEAKRLTTIIDDLLDLARIERGGATHFDMAAVRLQDAIGAAIAASVPPGDAARFSTDCPDDDLRVRGDYNKLVRAIANVIGNAFKYSGEGSAIALQAQAVSTPAGRAAMITVTDHGIGMEAHDIERAFERFHRGDQSGQRPGLGLGLSIVKSVMEGHGGRVELRSVPGRGTVVSLELPLLSLRAEAGAEDEASLADTA